MIVFQKLLCFGNVHATLRESVSLHAAVFCLLELDILGEELNGGLANLLAVVIGVSGDGESADRRQQSPESATGDPVNDLNADPAQNIFSHPHRDTLQH